jgi:hypothetical protein
MKFIGQYIQKFIARFKNDVYLEEISSGTIASGGNLGLDSNNKIVKANEPTLHDAVTLAGTPDYITLSGQEITRNAIDLAADVTGTLPVGNGGTGLTSISTLLNSNVTTISGNSGTATKLATERDLQVDLSENNAGGFDGSQNVSDIGVGSSVLGVANGGTGLTSISTLLNSNVTDASSSAKGVVELATTGEADTGTDTARAVTPAGLKSHVDARFAYQYISFTGSATVPSDGDWMTLSANGISNHTWNTDLGSGGTTVDTSTVTIPTGAICQGIIVPYDCTLVGYASLIRSVGNYQSKVGLAVGVPTYNDFATFDCTLRAYNAADTSAGPDSNYSQRPTRADSLSVNYSMSAGHVIFPLIGSVASNSRTVQWNCTLVLKTLLP